MSELVVAAYVLFSAIGVTNFLLSGIVFCGLIWWVDQNAPWRVGHPTSWGSTGRLVMVNAVLLLLLLWGLSVSGIATYASAFELAPYTFIARAPKVVRDFMGIGIPFITLVLLPIVGGAFVLVRSGHAAWQHSVRGMVWSYITVIVFVLARGLEALAATAFMDATGIRLHPMGAFRLTYFNWGDWTLLIQLSPMLIAFIATGGYVISEWLAHKEG